MTGKRPYRLGKRQASVDETKRRILVAAREEYAENGIDDTSMHAVARRADVAPGTVLYHYPDPDDLATAVIEQWLDEFEAPSPDAIDPDVSLQKRITVLVDELFGLYERSNDAYRAYQKSPGHPVMNRYEAWWYGNVNEMIARALGELASEPETMQVVSVLVNPGFRGTLVMTGLSTERSREIATDLIVSWLGPAG